MVSKNAACSKYLTKQLACCLGFCKEEATRGWKENKHICFLEADRRFRRGPLAQLVEQRPFKPRVAGSSPAGPSSYSLIKEPLGGSF